VSMETIYWLLKALAVLVGVIGVLRKPTHKMTIVFVHGVQKKGYTYGKITWWYLSTLFLYSVACLVTLRFVDNLEWLNWLWLGVLHIALVILVVLIVFPFDFIKSDTPRPKELERISQLSIIVWYIVHLVAIN
jgi:hypothetical protein